MNIGNLKRATEIARAMERLEDCLVQLEKFQPAHFFSNAFQENSDEPTWRAFVRATKTNIEKQIDKLKSEAAGL